MKKSRIHENGKKFKKSKIQKISNGMDRATVEFTAPLAGIYYFK